MTILEGDRLKVVKKYSDIKLNSTRIIVKGNNNDTFFSVEFPNKLISKFFKKRGIKIPKRILGR